MPHHNALAFGPAFDETRRLSPFVRRLAHARPGLVAELAARDARPWTREEIAAQLGPGDDLASRLRQVRMRVMLAHAPRVLQGMAPLDEVFATMSPLADETIRAATRQAQAETVERYGAPANG